MDGIVGWLAQLEWRELIIMLLTAAAALLCIMVHEICHGLAALALGDPTAKRAGRLTLNPLKHVDLVGLAMLIFARVGWAKAVPIDPRYFKNRRLGMALTALAGPGVNVLMAVLAAALYGVCFALYVTLESELLYWVSVFWMYVMYLSVGLAVFNLLPIPPLDGSKVLFAFLPEHWYWKLLRYERYGMIAVVVLMVTGLLDGPMELLRGGLLDALVALTQWTADMILT